LTAVGSLLAKRRRSNLGPTCHDCLCESSGRHG
jgi:hypothetical protein